MGGQVVKTRKPAAAKSEPAKKPTRSRAKKSPAPLDDMPRIEIMRLSEIARWPRNPKDHDLPGLQSSLGRWGAVDPPLVDEGTGRLVKGHGRLDAMLSDKAAGKLPPKRIAVASDGEWLVPVIRGIRFESASEAEGYVVADNQQSRRAGWDETLLAQILADQQKAGTLDGLGFDVAEVEAHMRVLDGLSMGPMPTAPDAFPAHDPTTMTTEHKCPKCGYEWSGASK